MGIKLNLEIKEVSFWSIETRGSKAFWSFCLWSLRRSSEGNKMFSALYTRINFHLSQRLLRKPKSITWIEIHFKACLFKKTHWKVDFDHKKSANSWGDRTTTVVRKPTQLNRNSLQFGKGSWRLSHSFWNMCMRV